MVGENRGSFGRLLSVGVAVALLSACTTTTVRTTGEAATAASEPVASAADPDGRMRGYQFARRYDDVVRIDGRSVQQTVEYGFDYDRALTVRRIYDADGVLVSEDEFPAESLRANPAEEARMQELIHTHPQLGPMMNEPGLLVHTGGFVVREPDDPYCGLGSRCLRFIVSKGDGSIPHIHAVVDLVSDRVVHPFYDDVSPAAMADKESTP